MLTPIHTEATLITGPTREPLDLEQVKKHVRVTATSEDTLIDGWIAAAREFFEGYTGRQIMAATWEQWMDAFPVGLIELPKPPLQSVTAVTYIDTDGVEQTWGSSLYVVRAPAGPHAPRGRLYPAWSQPWPTHRDERDAVRVRFLAGYGTTTGAVPDLVKTALYLLVGHFYRYREEVQEVFGGLKRLPVGVRALLDQFVSRQTVEPSRFQRERVWL